MEATSTLTAAHTFGHPVAATRVDAGQINRWAMTSIILAGIVTAFGLSVLAVTAGVTETGLRAVLACWTSVPYIVAGAIAWRRRPDSGLGKLMVVAGFATAITFLNWSSDDVLFTIGTATQFLPPLVFLLVFLTYPTGRLTGALERTVVGVAAVAALLTLVYMPLGYEGSRSVLTLIDSPGLSESFHDAQLQLMVVALAGGAVLLLSRRVQRGKPLRPWLGYLVNSFSLVLAMLALLYLVHLTGWAVATEPVRLATFALIGVAPIVFLFGLLQERLGRASVADLVAFSAGTPGPAELQEGVSKALRDSSARILYWIPDFDSYADVEGKTADPTPAPGMSSTPVTRDGSPVAVLLHDRALDDEPALLASVASATGMLIQKAQLEVELRARVEELRGSRIRILEAEQQERRRLERDLHDGAQQRLLALSLTLGELEAQLDDDGLRHRMEGARSEVAESLRELRDLAHGIHPASLIDHGLAVALESLATRSPIPVEVNTESLRDTPRNAELTAFYLVSESLANIAKHSAATRATIEAATEDDVLIVEVADNGIGGANTARGSGLRGLADRVETVGGRFRVWSPKGGGTRIRADIPCES